ncbi:MAG TPA: zinc-ribbon domain-containing protein [Terriglobia bacterium]|nr:zinc-ribbon domain-containing protein [Terriglobia bacterium]
MIYCGKCNAVVEEGSSFCKACGAPVVASSGSASQAGAQDTGMSANVAGLLTYILGVITGIIFLVIEPYKNNSFVRFHAFQSIFFNVALVAFWIAWSIITSILSFATFGVLGLAMAGLGLIIALFILLYWLFLMYKAYRNERYRIPYIGDLAAKQAG